jgi:hypothetical protein
MHAFLYADVKLALLSTDLEVHVLQFMGRALFKADRLIKGIHPDHFHLKEWEILTGRNIYPSWSPVLNIYLTLLNHVNLKSSK